MTVPVGRLLSIGELLAGVRNCLIERHRRTMGVLNLPHLVPECVSPGAHGLLGQLEVRSVSPKAAPLADLLS